MERMTREQAIELEQSMNWRLLAGEIDLLIKSSTEELILTDEKEITRLQEKIKALRFCMRLPNIIAEREEVDAE